MIDVARCYGCTDDFYNRDEGQLLAAGGRCWSLKTAKLVTRFRIHRDSMPEWKNAYTEMEVPHCYRQPGFSFQDQLPNFVSLSNVVRRRPAAP